MGTSTEGRTEVARKGCGERQEIRHSGYGGKECAKRPGLGKKDNVEQNSKEDHLIGAGYLGGLASTGKMGSDSSV